MSEEYDETPGNEQDYEVGYCRPPKHTRFKPGESGNPKGRPKETKDPEKLFDRELSKPIRINDGGQPRTLTKRDALVKQLVHQALQGDQKARQLVLKYMGQHTDIAQFEPDDEDRAALQALLDQQSDDDETEHEDNDHGARG